ncbi:hypothetical protein CTAYLR_000654 [Chrysophaeum taylorii]|uniref:Sigma 54 modulation/S30EA ribosomal protein C-terminal domain-containing protein n=1 Tax=Chrysophaeum taylorii TaxID=2483200 RepID=A0AAD7U9E6_9STRA|nr:hypothetical protein CTAYLR_000654 [Chrysophaeum taylorii]
MGLRSPVKMVVQPSPLIKEIQANNLEMTPSMRDYVERKIGGTIDRFSSMISRCDAHLSVNRNPRVPLSDCCEVVIFAKDNHVVRAEERAETMYAAIDLVAAKLARKLRKLKERRTKAPKLSIKETIPGEIEIVPKEAEVKPETLVRRKSFPMPPQSLEEATDCLYALDHDFYLFKNVESGQLNVLYKRKEGGLGLLEPEERQ